MLKKFRALNLPYFWVIEAKIYRKSKKYSINILPIISDVFFHADYEKIVMKLVGALPFEIQLIFGQKTVKKPTCSQKNISN